MGIHGVRELQDAVLSTKWPIARGHVVHSSVDRQTNNERTTYHAVIMYNYEVNGTVYSGSRVAYGDYGSSNPIHAREIVDRYPKGKEVMISHMPESPGVSLLEPGIKIQAWIPLLVGLVFFAGGVFIAITLPKAIRRQRQNRVPVTD